MKGYQTEQKKRLLSYLSAHADATFTLDQLAAAMAGCGVGKSTLYRLVAHLCEEGRVQRYARERGRGYTYQFLAAPDCHSHLHLRCTACGGLIHVSRAASCHLAALLQEENGFTIDDSRTLLFGRCAACTEQGR